VHVFASLTSAPDATSHPNTARWYKHIQSYEPEHKDLAGSSKAGESFTAGTAAAGKEDATGEEDEEIDLFGDDDEEDAEAERVKAERVAAYNEKKANKPKTIAKVSSSIYQVQMAKYGASFIVRSNNGC
jgi:elongation factor 1-beta